jgi:hypothetical protein
MIQYLCDKMYDIYLVSLRSASPRLNPELSGRRLIGALAQNQPQNPDDHDIMQTSKPTHQSVVNCIKVRETASSSPEEVEIKGDGFKRGDCVEDTLGRPIVLGHMYEENTMNDGTLCRRWVSERFERRESGSTTPDRPPPPARLDQKNLYREAKRAGRVWM